MYTIVADTISEGHEKVVKLIAITQRVEDDVNLDGVVTEDLEATYESPEPVNIHVNYPLKDPVVSKASRFRASAMQAYVDQVLTPRPLKGDRDFSYLYSNLLFDHPIVVFNDGNRSNPTILGGNGDSHGIDQIAWIVEKLSKSMSSRRAVASLFNPVLYEPSNDPPCLNHVQFMIRDGVLNMHALFRSNDMLSAWGANAYALSKLQEMVAKSIAGNTGTDIPVGYMETTSISAHIYYVRDAMELAEFRKLWLK